jgi:hypothetical protein
MVPSSEFTTGTTEKEPASDHERIVACEGVLAVAIEQYEERRDNFAFQEMLAAERSLIEADHGTHDPVAAKLINRAHQHVVHLLGS